MSETFDLIEETTMPALLGFGDPALGFFSKRDLAGEPSGRLSDLWELPDVKKILEKQSSDGSWPYPKRATTAHPTENYQILQTLSDVGLFDRDVWT